MLNILLSNYNNSKQTPIIIYKLNKNGIISAQVFILYHLEISSL